MNADCSNADRMNSRAELQFMARAVELARQGVGHVAPNPPVGAVAVRDGDIIAEGYHHVFGGAHAERDLIDQARRQDIDLAGADLFVSLEPCGHHGKTAPCSRAIVEAGFRRVLYAVADPHPRTAGVGPAELERHGIEARLGPEGGDAETEAQALQEDARWLLAPYLRWVTAGVPLVTAKWAMTADGRLATDSGDARWISSPETRADTRAERGHYDAILVGRATVAADDPQLTSRTEGCRDPVRVVVDSELRTDPGARLLTDSGPAPVWIVGCEPPAAAAAGEPGGGEHRARLGVLEERGATVWLLPAAETGGVSLPALMELLAEHDVQHLLVEGGGRLQGAFLELGLLDRAQVVVAPKLVGGLSAPRPLAAAGVANMSQAFELATPRWRQCGPDMILEGALTAAGRGCLPAAPNAG